MQSPTPAEINTHLLEHLVEAASLKADVANIKSAQNDLTTRLLTQMGEIAGDVKAIRADLSTVPEKINACRIDMRREIERDFPSKPEVLQMEQRIEKKITDTDKTLGLQIADLKAKVDKLWVKIAATTTGAITVLGGVAWLIANISPGVLR